ncbi:hypothetical protein BDW67DRAFT_189314 [Aspergillus spinulosporus]
MAHGLPLVRYGLTSDGHFVWTVHHAVYDGWSLPLVFDQLQTAYEHSTLPGTAPGFNTFIKHMLQTNAEATQTFWMQQLDSPGHSSSFPELRCASYRPSVCQITRHIIPFSPSSQTQTLKTTVHRAARALLLPFYAESQDVIFGTTLSGRNGNVPGIDRMVAPLITTVPVRVQLASALSVADFLRQVQQQATDMIPHEYYGLQKIASLSNACARAVEFQNLFVIQPSSATTTADGRFLGCELPLQGFDS